MRTSCAFSRRGHTWRELGAVPNAAGIIDHARRICAKCQERGYVNNQGIVISGEALANSAMAWST